MSDMIDFCAQITPNVRGATMEGSLWPNGSHLYVKFMDGTDIMAQDVMSWAAEWSQYANVRFIRSATISDIRVTFNGNNAYSFVGTTAKLVRPDRPTMGLGAIVNQSYDYARGTTLHEFGHALGLIHEHLSPASEIEFDAAKTYEFFYKTYGWERDQVDINLLVKPASGANGEFDKHSIMLYALPESITGSADFESRNIDLSEEDKRFISELYPIPMSKRI